MYIHIIGVDNELLDIIEDGINFQVDYEGIIIDRKSLIIAQKKMYKKHRRVGGILIDDLHHSEYTDDKSSYVILSIFFSHF